MTVLIPAPGVTAIVDETATFGVQDLETGGFLLAPRASCPDRDSPVAVIALAGDTGIMRGRGVFQISGRALDRIFTFADDHDLWIPAQFHSHKVGAFLSWTDQRHGLRVDEFISSVIPTYACPPRDLARWGWWQFVSGAWHGTEPGRVTGETVETLRFDEAGVHGL
jgi:hypothetical protein